MLSSKKNNKITKIHRPFKFNIGIIVFLMIFIYISVNVFIYVTRDKVSVYTVVKGMIVEDNRYTGVILRDEEAFTASVSGYVNYYIHNGERVAKDSNVYLLDETGKITDALDKVQSSEENSADSTDYTDVKKAISVYAQNYDENRFEDVYTFKSDIQNKVTEMMSDYTITNLDTILSSGVEAGSYQIVTTERSGIVSYTVDGMEGLTIDEINKDTFTNTDYEKNQMESSRIVEAGNPVYKLTYDENWSVVIPLDDTQAKKLEEMSSVTVKFLKDGVTTTADISLITKDDGIYAKLSLSKYMIRYINDRYIDLEIVLNSANGLKIPVTSIVEKDFYTIPVEYLATDEESFNQIYTDENGEIKNKVVKPTIYYNDGEFCYVDKEDFQFGDSIGKLDSDEAPYRIGATGQLTGVYNINKGYSVFKIVHILYQNEEYCIVEANTAYGISLYDNIILNGNSINEDELVY